MEETSENGNSSHPSPKRVPSANNRTPKRTGYVTAQASTKSPYVMHFSPNSAPTIAPSDQTARTQNASRNSSARIS